MYHRTSVLGNLLCLASVGISFGIAYVFKGSILGITLGIILAVNFMLFIIIGLPRILHHSSKKRQIKSKQKFLLKQMEGKKKSRRLVDTKTFKKTYPYICSKCGNFTYTQQTYCEMCGAENSLRKTTLADINQQK
ncbi:MAG: hypothetical protein ACFFG0_06415 [Candidatus Thorarchaeota archaeon]